jgi:hypothetical protein
MTKVFHISVLATWALLAVSGCAAANASTAKQAPSSPVQATAVDCAYMTLPRSDGTHIYLHADSKQIEAWNALTQAQRDTTNITSYLDANFPGWRALAPKNCPAQ